MYSWSLSVALSILSASWCMHRETQDADEFAEMERRVVQLRLTAPVRDAAPPAPVHRSYEDRISDSNASVDDLRQLGNELLKALNVRQRVHA